jgi:hypothetical protein
MLRRMASPIGHASALLATLVLGACGGGDDVDCKMVEAKPSPPATQTLVSLSADQRGLVCDRAACQHGGYGNQGSCSSGPPVMFATSRGQCLSQWPSNPECRATVKDLMDCMAAVTASPCTSTFLTSSACEPATQFECITFRPNAAVGMVSPAQPPPP